MSNQDTQTVTFADFPLSIEIQQAIEEVGYETPSPIQAQSIQPLLDGNDLLGMAQTGTGKTAAFSLPLLSNLDAKARQTQLLVLCPTRELAIQVAEAMQTYAKHIKGFHVLPIYGGAPFGPQLKGLREGVQVVVGTPGRVQDHLNRGSLVLSNLKALVLDEADEMLRMGFIDDIENILSHTPDDQQLVLFSATMPPVIERVANKYLKNPVEVKIKAKTQTNTKIRQRYIQVVGQHKMDALTRIMEAENFDALIIFGRTKSITVEIATKLEARGFKVSALNGDMDQKLREKVVGKVKDGLIDVMVATDVAARGLDVERITHVINYDIPTDPESYVHRIGRTGRAGREGDAILFVAPRERRLLGMIERVTKQKIEQMPLPSHEVVASKRITEFKTDLTAAIEGEALDYFKDVVESYALEHPEHDIHEIAAALTYLAQKDKPLQVEEEAIDRAPADNPRERMKAIEEGYTRYKLSVGRKDKAQAKHIVGALANEAEVDSQYIHNVTLFDTFTTVDMPSDMPSEVLNDLKGVIVQGRKLNITEFKDKPPRKGGRGKFSKSRSNSSGQGNGQGNGKRRFSGKNGPRRTRRS